MLLRSKVRSRIEVRVESESHKPKSRHTKLNKEEKYEHQANIYGQRY